MATVGDICTCLERRAPRLHQEDWDNSGLQTGDPAAPVRRVLVALDATKGALDQAVRLGAAMIVTHHPLIFKPLRTIDGSPSGLAAACIRNGVALYSLHTPLDVMPGGVSDALARAIGLPGGDVLAPVTKGMYAKLVVFVTPGDAPAVLDALQRAGAGEFLRYERCSFESQGTGRFSPKPGARPAVRSKRFKEARLELLVRNDWLPAVLQQLRAVHPYDEPAYDVFSEAACPLGIGYGIAGELKKPVKLSRFLEQVKTGLGISRLRFSGDPNRPVRRVAVCGGSGAGFIPQAVAAGADVYVTGDLKYHDVLDQAHRIALVDAGHRATELPVLPVLAAMIGEGMKGVDVAVYRENNDFFDYC